MKDTACTQMPFSCQVVCCGQGWGTWCQMEGCSHTLATSSCQFLRTKDSIPGLGCGLTSPDFPVHRGGGLSLAPACCQCCGESSVWMTFFFLGLPACLSGADRGCAQGEPQGSCSDSPQPGAQSPSGLQQPGAQSDQHSHRCHSHPPVAWDRPPQVATKQRRGHCHPLPACRNNPCRV